MAEGRGEAVVASASGQGTLRTERVVLQFKGGVRVIVESAHEHRVLFERNVEATQELLYGVVVREGVGIHMIEQGGRIVEQGTLVFDFGVEDAERIRVEAALARF